MVRPVQKQLRNGIGNKRELVLKLTRVEKQDHRAIMKTYHLKSLTLGRDCVVSLTSGQAQKAKKAEKELDPHEEETTERHAKLTDDITTLELSASQLQSSSQMFRALFKQTMEGHIQGMKNMMQRRLKCVNHKTAYEMMETMYDSHVAQVEAFLYEQSNMIGRKFQQMQKVFFDKINDFENQCAVAINESIRQYEVENAKKRLAENNQKHQ